MTVVEVQGRQSSNLGPSCALSPWQNPALFVLGLLDGGSLEPLNPVHMLGVPLQVSEHLGHTGPCVIGHFSDIRWLDCPCSVGFVECVIVLDTVLVAALTFAEFMVKRTPSEDLPWRCEETCQPGWSRQDKCLFKFSAAAGCGLLWCVASAAALPVHQSPRAMWVSAGLAPVVVVSLLHVTAAHLPTPRGLAVDPGALSSAGQTAGDSEVDQKL